MTERISDLSRLVERHSIDQPSVSLSPEHLTAIEELAVSIQQLPQAVSAALGDALRRQHTVVINDIRSILRDFLRELQMSESAVRKVP